MRIPPNERRLRRLQIRRGSESQRIQVVFEEGEPVMEKTKKRVFIGDSKKYGGNIMSNLTFMQQNNSLNPRSEIFDLTYNSTDKTLSIVNNDNNTLREITPNMTAICNKASSDLDILDDLLSKLEIRCCTPQYRLITDRNDREIDILTDDPAWIKTRDV